MGRFQGQRWPKFNSIKTADIVFADIQGQDALLAQFATSKYGWAQAEMHGRGRPACLLKHPC